MDPKIHFLRKIFYLGDVIWPGINDVVMHPERDPRFDGYKEFRRQRRTEEVPGWPSDVHRVIAPDISKFPEMFPCLRIEVGKRFSGDFPDRLTYLTHDLLSAAAKSALETFDPGGGHQFVSATVEVSDPSFPAPEYFWMVNGRGLWMDTPREFEMIPHVRPRVGYVGKMELFTEERALFVSSLPIWTGPGYFSIEHASEAFIQHMRNAGLTGFEDFDRKKLIDEGPDGDMPGSVGHVLF